MSRDKTSQPTTNLERLIAQLDATVDRLRDRLGTAGGSPRADPPLLRAAPLAVVIPTDVAARIIAAEVAWNDAVHMVGQEIAQECGDWATTTLLPNMEAFDRCWRAGGPAAAERGGTGVVSSGSESPFVSHHVTECDTGDANGSVELPNSWPISSRDNM